MTKNILKSSMLACFLSAAATAWCQTPDADRSLLDLLNPVDNEILLPSDSIEASFLEADTIIPLITPSPLPSIAFMPVVFDRIEYLDTLDIADPSPLISNGDDDWLRVEADRFRRYRELKQAYMIHHPEAVRYNINTLPEPPKKYVATVDPQESTITLSEIVDLVPDAPPVADAVAVEINRRNWLHDFSAALQFSQAYISPNWYQGGNNNLNMIGNVRWNVKLNNKFHPNVIAEATTQYKLAIASAPQDECHNYTISEDLFQFNGTLGLKARDRWYYSLNGVFKTQFLNSYPTNSYQLQAAFLSPAELNVGLGMTYNYANPKKTLQFDVSIAPISYNMKMSRSHRIPVTNFGIHEGHRSISEIGSSVEAKLKWDIVWNISYQSRLFLFTNYDYLQGDWENTFNFSINRYLSTQLYLHLRYDSSRPEIENSKWRKWQLKEILSFGLQYQFKTI